MLLLSECAFAERVDPAAALPRLLSAGTAHHAARRWTEPGTMVAAPGTTTILNRAQFVFPAALVDPQWVAGFVEAPTDVTVDLGLQYRVLDAAGLGMTDVQLAHVLCNAVPPPPWHHSSHLFLSLDSF